MKILGIEHVAIAVENLEKESPFWSEVLGLKQTALEDVPSQGVITDIYDTARGKIELLKKWFRYTSHMFRSRRYK